MTMTPTAGDEGAPAPSPFFDTGEAAAYLRLELRTLVNWRSRGDGPRWRKHGGRVVYHRDDLETWSRNQARGRER